MADTFSISKRSEIMSRITGKNTSPELAVRKVLSSLGGKYRLHDKKLFGKPDIVIKRLKTVFFINGCFWHQHTGCKRKSVPKSNKDYWEIKLKNNVLKQKQDIIKLKKLGWNVFIVWECETKNQYKLFDKIKILYAKINSL